MDTAETGDTGDTTETGETGDSVVWDSAEGDYPYNCGELTTPQTVSTHSGFVQALPLVALDQQSVELALTRAVEWRVEAGGDCDPVVIDGAGRTILDGDCTAASGASFTGFAVVQSAADGSRSFELEELSVTYSSGEDTLYFWGDGTLTLTLEGEQIVDMHYIYEAAGGQFPTGSSEFIRHQDTTQDGFNVSGKGYVNVISSSSLSTGEMCFDAAFASDIATCGMEATGYANLVGDAVVEGVMDGATACDACINMTVDGTDLGSVCP